MKKIIVFVLVVCIVASTVAVLAGCKDKNEPVDYTKFNILYLGDSIAEAIVGVSPEVERENYGYFGIIGQVNKYTYSNRAISGNQTGELLAYIRREEEDAYLTKSMIGQADVICISITGNDLLWHNFPMMLFELAAKEKFGEDYVNQQVVKDGYEYKRYQVINEAGDMRTVEKGETVPSAGWRWVAPGDGLATFERVKQVAKSNVEAVVEELHTQNPQATIIFQNVYNPVDDESEIIPMDLVADLMKIDAKYDYATEAGVEEYRKKGAYMLGAMSDILKGVAEKNDKVEFVDVAKAFDEIYRNDRARGKKLIFVDGVHPSDQGHAVIAATLQKKMVELGFAEGKNSLEAYKTLRVDQLTRLYKGVSGFDYDGAVAKVNAAKEFDQVSVAYFGAVEGYEAKLSADPAEGRATNGVFVKEEEHYDLSRVVSKKADYAAQEGLDGVLKLLDPLFEEKRLTLSTDGVMEIKVTLCADDVKTFLSLVNLDGMVLGGKEDTFYQDAEGNLTNLKMNGAMDAFWTISAYADQLFPGLGFTKGTLGANFHYLFDSLGLGIEGLEPLMSVPYVDEAGLPVDMAPEGTVDQDTVGKTYASYVDYLCAYLGRYQEVVDADGRTLHVDKLPAGVTAKLGEIGDLTMHIKTAYSLKTVTASDGKTYEAVYCGAYRENTSPWLVMTKYVDDDGKAHLKMCFEVMGIEIHF